MSLTRGSSAGSRSLNVFPVRQNQQFRVLVRLPLEALDGLGSHCLRFFVRHRHVTKRMPRAYL